MKHNLILLLLILSSLFGKAQTSLYPCEEFFSIESHAKKNGYITKILYPDGTLKARGLTLRTLIENSLSDENFPPVISWREWYPNGKQKLIVYHCWYGNVYHQKEKIKQFAYAKFFNENGEIIFEGNIFFNKRMVKCGIWKEYDETTKKIKKETFFGFLGIYSLKKYNSIFNDTLVPITSKDTIPSYIRNFYDSFNRVRPYLLSFTDGDINASIGTLAKNSPTDTIWAKEYYPNGNLKKIKVPFVSSSTSTNCSPNTDIFTDLIAHFDKKERFTYLRIQLFSHYDDDKDYTATKEDSKLVALLYRHKYWGLDTNTLVLDSVFDQWAVMNYRKNTEEIHIDTTIKLKYDLLELRFDRKKLIGIKGLKQDKFYSHEDNTDKTVEDIINPKIEAIDTLPLTTLDKRTLRKIRKHYKKMIREKTKIYYNNYW